MTTPPDPLERDRITIYTSTGQQREVNEDTDYWCEDCSTLQLDVWHRSPLSVYDLIRDEEGEAIA